MSQERKLEYEANPRTARAIAQILSQATTDEALRNLDQTDGRNQSEQAGYLGKLSDSARDLYERGGSRVDNVLIVPKENLTLPPPLEITTERYAVERLTGITKNEDKAKELAGEFVRMAGKIMGSGADGATQVKTYQWLYRSLEGNADLLQPEAGKQSDLTSQTETRFAERWQQIVELADAMQQLEPKDRLPEHQFEEAENAQSRDASVEYDENAVRAEIYENSIAVNDETREPISEATLTNGLIAFERIEVAADVPAIPNELLRADFEKLLDKCEEIDRQFEQGVSVREVLQPFKRYVENSRLDNELRLIEEEYLRQQSKSFETQQESTDEYKFVPTREELRELAEDREALDRLAQETAKLQTRIDNDFSGAVDRRKVEQSIVARTPAPIETERDATKQQNLELTEEEAELRNLLVEQQSNEREIGALEESIAKRENGFVSFERLAKQSVAPDRQQTLFERVAAMELPHAGLLREKYPQLSAGERNQKITEANTFEVQTPAEYLLVRTAAAKQFEVLRGREIKREREKFDDQNLGVETDARKARRELDEHRAKLETLKNLEPNFAYKIAGSNRIIVAKPETRATAGYKFAQDYVRYQLWQPETRLRHESATYREFAARLEKAKTVDDVKREGYRIRQENHDLTQKWKAANSETRRELDKPLAKNELTLLFLEQSPKSYTSEMTAVKLDFAHYSTAKSRMTDALDLGRLEPSAEARKLVESLESRLNRRDIETQRKATRHFFESLRIENDKLAFKNEFDHRAAYQKLPPHEKDWVYNRAAEQRENLDYKIAFAAREKTTKTAAQSKDAPTASEAARLLKQDFAAETMWRQAGILSRQTERSGKIAASENRFRQTIGVLLHNQSAANNQKIGDWLARQQSAEMRTASEILKTFAAAERRVENNRLTISVKVPEKSEVSRSDYKELFEQYFPPDFQSLKEFRRDSQEPFKLEQSRRAAQNETLENWRQNAQTQTYKLIAPATVFKNENKIVEEIERIKNAQIECRRAAEAKQQILAVYEEKIKRDSIRNKQPFDDKDLRAAVEHAFAPEVNAKLSPAQQTVFELAQQRILIGDFERFEQSSQKVEQGVAEINQSFERIAALNQGNSRYKFEPESADGLTRLQQQYEAAQQQREAAQISRFAREQFAASGIGETINAESPIIADSLSDKQREQIRIESHKNARINLEPTELNELNLAARFESKAFAFTDALDKAHEAAMQKADQTEVAAAFELAETRRKEFDESVKIDKAVEAAPKPATLVIYERELARNERKIARAKLSEMLEVGNLSLVDLETKRADEIFSPKQLNEIRLEAGERTRENLEPKELWANRLSVSQELQQTALTASDSLEKAHEIYHFGANATEVRQTFAVLDKDVSRLKTQRRSEREQNRFAQFKTDFKRDLAVMFESGRAAENPQVLTAMTKGLLVEQMERNDRAPEKIGVNREKLNEISLTIALAVTDERSRDKGVNRNFESTSKPHFVEPADNEKSIQQPIMHEKQHTRGKVRQFEQTR